jgi:hypothetical protein
LQRSASPSITDTFDKMVKTAESADPIVTRLVEEDKVRWYKKPNLRLMYVWLFLCCMGVEMTSGFDSQLINTLQFSTPFNLCKSLFLASATIY